jgi:phospholipid/cholesterol/gamma-HCH transport system ATP-binding protein
MSDGALIRFENVSKGFGGKNILDGVSFDVRKGEVFFVIGASGVGKSVTIKHLIGLLRPDAGDIWFDGREVSRLSEEEFFPVRKRIAMVFQYATLFDSMTCLENVALPLEKHRNLPHEEALAEARRLLDRVHLGKYGERFPAELGDGMKKRVAIARALTVNPEVILFDEPTTSLDPVSARRVDTLIRELSDTLGVTAIVVSHDLTSIFAIADRIVMLYRGKVRTIGDREHFRTTTDGVVRQFVGGLADGPMEFG